MNVYDNCDRCGVPGKVKVVLPSGLDLMFCGHHARAYKITIHDIATEVIYDDETLIADLQPV